MSFIPRLGRGALIDSHSTPIGNKTRGGSCKKKENIIPPFCLPPLKKKESTPVLYVRLLFGLSISMVKGSERSSPVGRRSDQTTGVITQKPRSGRTGFPSLAPPLLTIHTPVTAACRFFKTNVSCALVRARSFLGGREGYFGPHTRSCAAIPQNNPHIKGGGFDFLALGDRKKETPGFEIHIWLVRLCYYVYLNSERESIFGRRRACHCKCALVDDCESPWEMGLAWRLVAQREQQVLGRLEYQKMCALKKV